MAVSNSAGHRTQPLNELPSTEPEISNSENIEPPLETSVENNTKTDPKIPNDKIFGFMESSFLWDFDPADTENLFDENSLAIAVEVLSKGEAVFLCDGDNFDRIPYTPINVRAKETYYGKTKSNEKTIYIRGGDVLLKDLIEFNDKYFPLGRNEKMGLDKLSEEDINSMYMSFRNEATYEFSKESEYILILNNDNDFGEYIIQAGGYGVFEKSAVNSSKSSSINQDFSEFRNVISGKSFEIPS